MSASKSTLRTLLAAALALTLAFTTGCARKNIEFWHIQVSDPTAPVVNDAVKRFQDATGISVEVVSVANDDFKTMFGVALASHDLPDVFHTWGGGVLQSAVKAGDVADLTDLVPQSVKDRFSPAALNFVTYNDRLYALPADVSLVVMWYNRDIFDRFALKPPATFDELLSTCRTLRQHDVTPIALGNLDRWPGCFYFCYLATRIGGTDPVAAAAHGNPGGSFSHPSFIEAGRRLRDLVQVDAFPEGFNGLNDTDARRLFFDGKAAMMLMGTWTLANAQKEAPSFLAKMGCFPFPTVKDGVGSPRTVLGGVNAAYAVSAKSRNLKAAVALAVELVSDPTLKAWAATGRIPALARQSAEPLLPDQTLPPARILFDADAIQLYYDQYLSPPLAAVHKETTQDIFLGKLTPEAAAARMQTEALRLQH